jgi:hypothetical protein
VYTEWPHSALGVATPASRFTAAEPGRPADVETVLGEPSRVKREADGIAFL